MNCCVVYFLEKGRRVVITWFEDELSNASVECMVENLQRNASIALFINSPGGNVEPMVRFSETIKNRRLATIGYSVHSAALGLYLMGAKRLAFLDSTFFFHNTSFVDDGGARTTLQDLEFRMELARAEASPGIREVTDRYKGLINLNSEVTDFYSRYSGLWYSTIYNLKTSEVMLSGIEAKRLGLVDEIITDKQFQEIMELQRLP